MNSQESHLASMIRKFIKPIDADMNINIADKWRGNLTEKDSGWYSDRFILIRQDRVPSGDHDIFVKAKKGDKAAPLYTPVVLGWVESLERSPKTGLKWLVGHVPPSDAAKCLGRASVTEEGKALSVGLGVGEDGKTCQFDADVFAYLLYRTGASAVYLYKSTLVFMKEGKVYGATETWNSMAPEITSDVIEGVRNPPSYSGSSGGKS